MSATCYLVNMRTHAHEHRVRISLLTAIVLATAACPSEEANTPSTGPSDPASEPEAEPNTPEPPAAGTGETGKPST